MGEKEKDIWDKVNVVIQPMGGLLTGLAIASLGFFGSTFLNEKQRLETNSRLYTELMSKREESESALRKDMFTSIINTFFLEKPGSATLEAKMLKLELLAYNFHESFNLKPLFAHLKRQVSGLKARERRENMRRLDGIAREITSKEMLVLEEGGRNFDATIDLKSLTFTDTGGNSISRDLTADNITRNFKVVLEGVDTADEELNIRLEIRTPKGAGDVDTKTAEFTLNYFSFPMIDNTRLTHDQRSAVVLNNFDPAQSVAELTLVYFPGAYASVKEKPYIEELAQKLLKPSSPQAGKAM